MSFDSWFNLLGFTISQATYCLILYIYDCELIPQQTSLQLLRASDDRFYVNFVEEIKVYAQYLHLSGHNIINVGTNSCQYESYRTKKSTFGFIYYNSSPNSRLFKSIHMIPYEIDYESKETYQTLLNQIMSDTNSKKNIISVNVDNYEIPGYRKDYGTDFPLLDLALLPLLPDFNPTTLVGLFCYYTN